MRKLPLATLGAVTALGLLAASAMNGAVYDSTMNVFFKLKFAKTYDAMLATPLGPGDIAIGEITWAQLRGTLYSATFLLVMLGLAALGLSVTARRLETLLLK